MNNPIISVGKMSGRTALQALYKDPDWLIWAHKKNIFKNPKTWEAVGLILDLSSRIKIPQNVSEGHYFEYRYNWRRRMVDARISKKVEPYVRSKKHLVAFDLTDPHRNGVEVGLKYNKGGSKALVKAIRKYCFAGAYLTQARLETFYSDPRNFNEAEQPFWRKADNSHIVVQEDLLARTSPAVS